VPVPKIQASRLGRSSSAGDYALHTPPEIRQDPAMTQTDTTLRELAHRRNDGLDVRLVWDQARDRVYVELVDHKTGDGFDVMVLPGEKAMDVFHHPFAYQAMREASDRRMLAGTA
jgi:hypothetical protein